MSVKRGTEFRSTMADANPLWKVADEIRPGVYRAVCVNEPFEYDGRTFDSDFAGKVRIFTKEEITASLRHAALWESIGNEHDDWWAATTIGQTVHYHNSFGQYVRGVVVEHDGKHCIMPTALVGNWQRMDLPRRDLDGRVGYSRGGHYFEEGFEPWQPSSSCMFEHPSFRPPTKCPDPTGLDPIDLTVPDPTPEVAATERLHQLRTQILEALNNGGDVRAQLDAATFLLLQEER